MRLAVIPARGGSKRIPRKNIKLFAGQPMIAWSLSAAQQSGCFDRIIVSTDDAEISQVAQAYGAEVPFLRPPELSEDYIGTIPVVAHAIAWQNAHSEAVTQACCIYATAPFIQPKDLQRGLTALQTSGAKYAFAVTTYAFPIQRAIRITSEQRVAMFQPEQFETRSQDLDEAWHDAGQFYWGEVSAWLEGIPLFSKDAVPVPIPRHRAQDIDTPEDWRHAEWLFKVMQYEQV